MRIYWPTVKSLSGWLCIHLVFGVVRYPVYRVWRVAERSHDGFEKSNESGEAGPFDGMSGRLPLSSPNPRVPTLLGDGAASGETSFAHTLVRESPAVAPIPHGSRLRSDDRMEPLRNRRVYIDALARSTPDVPSLEDETRGARTVFLPGGGNRLLDCSPFSETEFAACLYLNEKWPRRMACLNVRLMWADRFLFAILMAMRTSLASMTSGALYQISSVVDFLFFRMVYRKLLLPVAWNLDLQMIFGRQALFRLSHLYITGVYLANTRILIPTHLGRCAKKAIRANPFEGSTVYSYSSSSDTWSERASELRPLFGPKMGESNNKENPQNCRTNGVDARKTWCCRGAVFLRVAHRRRWGAARVFVGNPYPDTYDPEIPMSTRLVNRGCSKLRARGGKDHKLFHLRQFAMVVLASLPSRPDHLSRLSIYPRSSAQLRLWIPNRRLR